MPDKLVWFALDPVRTGKTKYFIHYSDYATVITQFYTTQ